MKKPTETEPIKESAKESDKLKKPVVDLGVEPALGLGKEFVSAALPNANVYPTLKGFETIAKVLGHGFALLLGVDGAIENDLAVGIGSLEALVSIG